MSSPLPNPEDFSVINRELNVNRPPSFGGTSTVVIEQGPELHLLSDVLVAFRFPQLTANAGEEIRWVEHAPSLFIESATLVVNGTDIQTQSGLFSVLYEDVMQGKWRVNKTFLDRQQRSFAFFREQTPADAVAYVPLTLFFCKDRSAALPLFRMRATSKVEIRFKFRPFSQLYQTRKKPFQKLTRTSPPKPGTPIQTPEKAPACKVYAQYLTMSEANKAVYASVNHYLVALNETQDIPLTEPETTVRFDKVANPIRQLVWYVSKESNVQSNGLLNFSTADEFGSDADVPLYRPESGGDIPGTTLSNLDVSLVDRDHLHDLDDEEDQLDYLADIVDQNATAAFNLYYDLQSTQNALQATQDRLDATEEALYDLVLGHVGNLWADLGTVQERLQELEARKDPYPFEQDDAENHLLSAGKLTLMGKDLTVWMDYRYFFFGENYLRNTYPSYNVYSYTLSRKALGPLGPRSSKDAHDYQFVKDVQLRLRFNPKHVSEASPCRLYVYAMTFYVLEITPEGDLTLSCSFEDGRWACQPAEIPSPTAPPKMSVSDVAAIRRPAPPPMLPRFGGADTPPHMPAKKKAPEPLLPPRDIGNVFVQPRSAQGRMDLAEELQRTRFSTTVSRKQEAAWQDSRPLMSNKTLPWSDSTKQ